MVLYDYEGAVYMDVEVRGFLIIVEERSFDDD